MRSERSGAADLSQVQFLTVAEVVEVDGNHDVFLDAPGAFAHALTAACLAAVTVQSQPDGSEQAS